MCSKMVTKVLTPEQKQARMFMAEILLNDPKVITPCFHKLSMLMRVGFSSMTCLQSIKPYSGRLQKSLGTEKQKCLARNKRQR